MSAPLLLSPPLFPALPWWRNAMRHADDGVVLCGGIELRRISSVAGYEIATANGVLGLSVPVKGGRWGAGPLKDAEIDYTHHWRRRHWGALFSAYGRAPYFEHYAPALKALLDAGFRRLWDLNTAAIQWLDKEMRAEIPFILQEDAVSDIELKMPPETGLADAVQSKQYAQVFSARWPFQPGLSAIDLLMAEGPYAAAFF